MKYILQSNAKATENNKNFAGQSSNWYIGKQGVLDEVGKITKEWFAKEYGWSRMCDAVKAKKRQERLNEWSESYGHWEYEEVEIIGIDC